MDWRALLDERNRRQQSGYIGNSFQLPSQTMATVDPVQPEEDRGFFGNIGKAVGDTVGGATKAVGDTVAGVGGFFGNMVQDVAKAGEDAFTGIKDVVEGQIASDKLEKNSEELNKNTKAWSQYMQSLSEADWDNPQVKKKLQEFKDRSDAIKNGITDNDRKQLQESQDVDPTKTAAASAETFLNAASLGIGGLVKGGVKQAVKQGAKQFGKDVLTDTGEAAAKNVARAELARTAPGAARRIGAGAGEGALFGGAYGFIDPIADQGENVDLNDSWQGALLGAGLGGALGGAIPLLDKNVRAGVREIPGAVQQGGREAAANVAEAAQRYSPNNLVSPEYRAINDHLQLLNTERDKLISQGLSENAPALVNNTKAYQAALAERGAINRRLQGGYIRVPGAGGAIDDAAGAADDAARQLRGEPVDPMAASYINEQAASFSSPEQYVDDLVNKLWQDNKTGKGVDTWLIPDEYGGGFSGRGAVSNNSQFYQDFYKAHGGKPTKKGIRDIVEQELKGVDGEYQNILDSANPNGEAPFARDIYQQLVDRETALGRTMDAGPPGGMYSQFADDLGLPAQKVAQAAPEEKLGTASFGQQATPDAPLGGPGDPYAGMAQDFNRPALPQGELPKPPSVARAKADFKKTGEASDFVNTQRSGKKPIELPATTAEGADLAVRQTAGGKLKPFKYTSKDEVNAIRAIANDDTSSAFTMTRTPEMNLSEALKNRGGEASKEFRILDKYNTSVREHTADYTRFVDDKRDFLEKFMKEFAIDNKKATAMRPYLEAKDAKASQELIDQYRKDFGDQAADGLIRLRNWWRTTKDQVRSETNSVIEQYAGKDKIMGDLGESYVPRVYKSGKPGFKNTVLDTAHAGMDAIGGKKGGMFNLQNGTGYLSKETETFGGVLRNSEGIPLNSEFAKPNTTYLSAAQKRTANSPVKDLEDPITSMMRYFEATGRARYYTPDIAKGQELRDAIQLVNNETGNLRQMYKSFEDQVNAIAGKTSRIDRPFVDSESGAKFVNVATKLQSRVARSTILGSTSSALAQTGQLPLVMAENGAGNFAKGMRDLMARVSKTADDPMANSALMRARYPKYEDIFTTTKAGKAGSKGTAVVAKPFRLIEHTATELAWRSSYAKAIEGGLKKGSKEAIQEADRITAKIVGERSPGARAALYESKALGPVTSYTLEVNQLYQVAKQYFKRDPKKAAKLVGAIWLYNQGYKAITGNKLNADPVQATLDAGQMLVDPNYRDSEGNPIGVGERLIRAGGRLAGEAIDATPLGGPVVGQLYPENGFRVPFGGGARTLSQQDIFGDTNFGRYGGGTPLASGLSNPLLLLGIPGMNQAQRSVEGLNAVNQGASLTPSGDVRYLIDQSPDDYWRALLFGQYGVGEGQAYLQDQNRRLAGYAQ